jgi:hypothetical protein
VCPQQLRRRLKEILNTFATTTSLHINYHESTFVSIHVDTTDALEMTDILSCPVAEYFPQSYLGRGAY